MTIIKATKPVLVTPRKLRAVAKKLGLKIVVGWGNGRDISPRYHGTPRFPLTIYRTRTDARREFGLDAVKITLSANTQ